MPPHSSLDPYAKPPENIRQIYKHYQKKKAVDIEQDTEVLDFDREIGEQHKSCLKSTGTIDSAYAVSVFKEFGLEHDGNGIGLIDFELPHSPKPIFEHSRVPGLLIIPSLLPTATQRTLLSRLLHRDLNSPLHLTNVHLHHHLSYPPASTSFFSLPSNTQLQCLPLDPSIHRPISIQSLLSKKLRWVTLGGQYDWTAKKYPSQTPPDFPSDIARLLEGLFPVMRAQAAIVNFYSPGDTLSMHRDVAEQSERGLVSISIGCDALFIIGLDSDQSKPLVVRLRSGDAVFMTGPSRFAWHGVPQVMGGTCPDDLREWPAGSVAEDAEKYEHWKGWMAGKRINLNVRQMWD